jgi:hypothetical protein
MKTFPPEQPLPEANGDLEHGNSPLQEREGGSRRAMQAGRYLRDETDGFRETGAGVNSKWRPLNRLLRCLGIGLRKRQMTSPGMRCRSDPADEPPAPRGCPRLTCEMPAQIFDKDTHTLHPASICNWCRSGMYLQSEHAPRIGAGVMIQMIDHGVESAEPNDISHYYSRVIWREPLPGGGTPTRYGIGVRHCRDLEEFIRLFGL